MLDCTPKFSYTQYMLSLSDASKDTKEILKWGGLILVGLITILMLVRVVLYIKELIFPTPPPRPTIAFGKLQPQIFPQSATDKNLTYSINTLSGNLPNLPDQTKIYRMQKIQPDLLALNKARDMVGRAGFLENAVPITDRIFEWSNNPNLLGIARKLRLNIVNYDFTITSAYMSDQAVLSGKNLPNQSQAVDISEMMLENMSLLPEDIDLSKTKTNLFFIKDNALTSATSLSNSQIIEVNFYQKDFNNLSIYYEKPNSSNISILVGGGESLGQVVGANYIYQSISDDSSTYPLKTVSQAYEELKMGKAYIASYLGSEPNISIKKVFLGYYMGAQSQDFLMPIIIFQGDDEFYAYVPAVTDEWIEK